MATTQALTLINPFEVAPDADEAFVAGWRRAGALLATSGAYRAAALHRALRADVDFRFVDVARVDSPQAWREAISDPAFAGAKPPFPAHPGLYEVVREVGTPDIEGGVVLIAPFEVPEDQDEQFLAGWEPARDVLEQQRGYLGTRLYRRVGPAGFRFVDVARWSSPLMFARALRTPDVQQAAQAVRCSSHPALYQVMRH